MELSPKMQPMEKWPSVVFPSQTRASTNVNTLTKENPHKAGWQWEVSGLSRVLFPDSFIIVDDLDLFHSSDVFNKTLLWRHLQGLRWDVAPSTLSNDGSLCCCCSECVPATVPEAPASSVPVGIIVRSVVITLTLLLILLCLYRSSKSEMVLKIHD